MLCAREAVIAWSGKWDGAFSKERGHGAALQNSCAGDAAVAIHDPLAPASDLTRVSNSLLLEYLKHVEGTPERSEASTIAED